MVPNCLFSVVVVTHCVFFLMLFNVLMDLNYIVTVFHIETTVSVVLLACHCTEPPPHIPLCVETMLHGPTGGLLLHCFTSNQWELFLSPGVIAMSL